NSGGILYFMSVPYWVQDAIFYQIFPDRFHNGDPGNDPPNIQNWGDKPTIWDFQGGDLRGVIRKFDYLLDLGITAIYFNPIFQATSNHRYNISDYYKIDPKLGKEKDFLSLLDIAHQNNIRIVIDGVFNHCGRGFFAFNDVLENHSHSPYIDWFHLNNVPPDAYSPGDADDYEAWWKFKSLPKFNTDNPQVRNYIFDIARYWIRLGTDGWRLDVPNEIDDDAFWEEFRDVVKSENSDAYLVGEIWDGDPKWVGPKSFDGLMNYPIRDGVIGLLMGSITAEDFSKTINRQLNQYNRENVYAMYNPLGSHDTVRIKTELKGDQNKLKLAYLFLMAYPGAPAIYYGDEIGLEGGKDPDCRKAFPWEKELWDCELRKLLRQLIGIRKKSAVLRRGSYHEILVDGKRGSYGFARKLGEDSLLIVLNASGTRRNYSLPVDLLGWTDGRIVNDLFSNQEFIVSGTDLNLTVEPWCGLWIN
ncbi:MAG: glycoside hydrolase family 13 protein, partial [Anaerolineales bacterium]|nr:glycoside hydrolase family 13 protein [Anaerolineales bacterium]